MPFIHYPGYRRPRPVTRLSLRQCTAMRLQMQRDSCSSWYARISWNYLHQSLSLCTVPTFVLPSLEYAMEASAPTLRADINQLRRAQRFATRLVRSDLTLAFNIIFQEITGGPECIAETVYQSKQTSYQSNGTHFEVQLPTDFIPITYINAKTHLHGGGMLCTQASGWRSHF